MQRPCIGCGVLIERGSRCDDCKPKNLKYQRGRMGRTASDWRWRKLSEKLRRLSPFCEIPGCTSQDLTVDHIVPLSDPFGAELIHNESNLRVICRRHNAERGNRCTDAERAQVLDAIAKRRARPQLTTQQVA